MLGVWAIIRPEELIISVRVMVGIDLRLNSSSSSITGRSDHDDSFSWSSSSSSITGGVTCDLIWNSSHSSITGGGSDHNASRILRLNSSRSSITGGRSDHNALRVLRWNSNPLQYHRRSGRSYSLMCLTTSGYHRNFIVCHVRDRKPQAIWTLNRSLTAVPRQEQRSYWVS